MANNKMDPVRLWTFIILILTGVLLTWHLIADRITPFSSQARVHTLVVPISSEVSGTIVDVFVGNNQYVKAGQILFQIDGSRYQLDIDKARADLETARKSAGVSGADIDVAKAKLISAQAELKRAEKDEFRLKQILKEDAGAISLRRIESAEATLSKAWANVASAKANIDKARKNLGKDGEQNSQVLQAQSALDNASLNLEHGTIRAPKDGLVTDVQLDIGNYVSAGSPQLTFIAIDNVWVQADFTENNLGNIEQGNEVEIVFDVFPGTVFSGKVREMGYGVALDSAPLGSLPTIDNDNDWLRSAQRYPVLIDFSLLEQSQRNKFRVGSQASVTVFTGDNKLLNLLARFRMWLNSMITYAY